MRLSVWVRVLALVLSLIWVGGLTSPGAYGEGLESRPLFYVIHVDVMPQYTQPATALLLKYREDSGGESGCKRVEVLQQVVHTNHFTLVEEWQDEGAYDRHVSTQKTRDFRTALHPMLGAPFDERAHLELK